MKLYHGSHIEVKNPKILTSSRVGDFGRGFYTTSSLEQARRWAQIRAKQEELSAGIVTAFEVPDNLFEHPELRIKTFENANEEWLDFVLANRKIEWARLRANGVTSLGAAFRELNQRMSRNGFLNSPSLSFAPVIFLMTDGYPSDDQKAIL